MGKRGPKPKATSLKILEGIRGDRINLDEPKYPVASTSAPIRFEGDALDLWNELIPILTDAHVFTAGDRVNLELLCECYAIWRKDAENWKAREMFIKLSDRFGLNPSSRSSIKVVPQKPADELSSFLEKKA